MDYIKEISPEQAVILWQESRLSLSRCYEKAPEILKVHGSVIGTLGNFSASIGKAKSKKTFNVSAIVAAALKNGTVLRYAAELPEEEENPLLQISIAGNTSAEIMEQLKNIDVNTLTPIEALTMLHELVRKAKR